MTKSSIEAQIKELRKLWMTPRQRNLLLYACLVLSPAAFVMGYLHLNPIILIAGFVLSGLSICLLFSPPHLQNAIGATYASSKKSVHVDMYVNSNIKKMSYQSVVTDSEKTSWNMEFLPPKNWVIDINQKKYKAYYIKNCAWPVLLTCEEGLLYPSTQPHKNATDEDFLKIEKRNAKEEKAFKKIIEQKSKYTMSPTIRVSNLDKNKNRETQE